jgi:hypothetical protein
MSGPQIFYSDGQTKYDYDTEKLYFFFASERPNPVEEVSKT